MAPAFAAASDPALAPAGAVPDPDEKIGPDVEKDLAAGPTDFWLELADTADLTAAKDLADWDERGRFVYDTLTAVADASQAGLVKDLDAAGADYETFWISNAILVRDGDGALATSLAASPEVERISAPRRYHLVEPVERDKVATQGTQSVEWGLQAINADDAWALGYTGQGVTVANIDSGVQGDHPALASHYRGLQDDGSVVDDYNWFDTSNACAGDSPCDTDGHGSHTMGTMVGDDGAGNQIGVAPGADWIAANGCATCSNADLLESGQWILAPTKVDGSDADPSKRPQVVNNSWGYDSPGVIDDFMADQIDAWEAAGIFGAWSGGNEGPACTTTSSPGANANTYAVGAFDSSGAIASFSSRGTGEDGTVKPNISAPGVNVRSSVPGDGYASYNGTSMAAPHLAGAVALLWSAAPSLVGQIEETQALLDGAAVDVDDTTCGGTADDNNVWGEGRLDVMTLLDAAPVGDTGLVTGTVTDADGAPVDGAEVTFDGSRDRTVTTGDDGAFAAELAVGDYAVSAQAFGYVASAPADVAVTVDATVTLPITLERAATRTVSGTVTEKDGAPTAGAVVALSGPLDAVTTGDDGRYAIAGVPDGTYTLSVSAGTCAEPFSTEVVVDGDETVDAALKRLLDDYGYYCTTGSAGVASGDTLLALTGDDKAASVDLPFAFPYYGEAYDTAYVSTNGFLNFLASSTSLSNVALPAAAAPNAAVYPFWDDLNVDAASAVYTGVTTVEGVDAFVVEWRNVRKYRPETDRVNFSATLLADGRVTLGYGPVTDTTTARGDSATIGIEDAAGAVASQFSYNAAAVTEGLSVTYDLAGMGSVRGTVSDGNTDQPVEGVTVTITSKDDGDETVVTTGSDGTYAARLPLERYGITYAKDEYAGATRNAALTEDGQVVTRDVALGAGRLEVNKESVSAALGMGGTASRAFRLTNTGTEPVDVTLGAGGGGFEMLGATAADGGVISHVTDAATVPEPAGPSMGTTGSGLGTADGKNGLASSGAKAGTVSPDLSAVPLDETTLTHSASQDIVANNSAACTNQVVTQDNGYLRTFTLSDFGIDGSLDVSSVSFGVEAVRTAQPLTVNLYTLDGALTYANMTLVGSAEATVGTDAAGTVVSVPVTGEVPKGGTLVVEVDVPAGGWFFAGSNDAGQTAPTYIRSEACGLLEPTDTTEVDFPDMHLVMNVSGETSGGAGVAWLDVQPPELTLAPGASVQAAVTLSAVVEQPGAYSATITAGEDTPYAAPTVSALMTVKAPTGWGKVAGTVTGDGAPLDGAVVNLDGKAYDTTLVTGADGTYGWWMPRPNGPLQLVVAANGFVPAVRTAQIVAGQTSVYDVDLKPLP
ncbi:carboxypeptidase regulatory-like domain-containing protein [Krasilnikoviella flava]|uniref:carboxypeptidase regulatory-like domain-containing protein n=1 Tax=Krasilnikoviella flava TaxID=526729 RepID=UPI0009A7B574|nr:carboxypeptidase regulatory-like domain-containing protein [Krasilnikoviella flava]